jgi:peptidyl-prolyl cis-trans isomerase A (cyclophilin A)
MPGMQATLHTNRGDITIDLFDDTAPKTVANFTSLAKGEPTWRDQELGQDRSTPSTTG